MPGFMAPIWIQLGLAWETWRTQDQQRWGDAVEAKGDSFIAFQRAKETRS